MKEIRKRRRGEGEHRCERVTWMKVAALGLLCLPLSRGGPLSFNQLCLFIRYLENFVPLKCVPFFFSRGEKIFANVEP